MTKIYVIKNLVTGKYYTGTTYGGKCSAKYLINAEIFDRNWETEVNGKPTLITLGKNEKFVEIEIKEKSKRK